MLDLTPLRLLLVTFAGWVTRQQGHVVDVAACPPPYPEDVLHRSGR